MFIQQKICSNCGAFLPEDGFECIACGSTSFTIKTCIYNDPPDQNNLELLSRLATIEMKLANIEWLLNKILQIAPNLKTNIIDGV